MPRFVVTAGAPIASALLRLMHGTGYAVQRLMTVRAGAYGRSPDAAGAAGADRAIATVLGAAVWTILLIFASLALA
jgi:hypothetical protein